MKYILVIVIILFFAGSIEQKKYFLGHSVLADIEQPKGIRRPIYNVIRIIEAKNIAEAKVKFSKYITQMCKKDKQYVVKESAYNALNDVWEPELVK